MDDPVPLRLRLVFEDPGVLTERQRSDGLDRCWVLLQPELSTVSGLASYLQHYFDLYSSCPDGLALFMDDFALPPFESTSIFRDKDVIGARKKDVMTRNVIEADSDTLLIEDVDIVEKLPILPSEQALAAVDGVAECRTEEEDVAKDQSEEPDSQKLALKRKRKQSNLHSSKRKKNRLNSAEEQATHHAGGNENVHTGQSESSCSKKKLSEKSSQRNDSLCNGSHKSSTVFASDVNGIAKGMVISTSVENKRKKNKRSDLDKQTTSSIGVTKVIPTEHNGSSLQMENISWENLKRKDRSQGRNKKPDPASDSDHNDNATDTVEPALVITRHDHVEDKIQGNEQEPQANGTLKKFPSRNARRKKIKRQLLRERMQEGKQEELAQNHAPVKINCQDASLCQTVASDAGGEDAFIPVIVKPGHIRFEPLDDEEQIPQRSHDQAVIEWNGTLDKKKGQRWGREKVSTGRIDAKYDACEEFSQKDVAEEGEMVADFLEYEKLPPLTCLPKEGDMVAYRLVELSSSWCPEISSFRVGKVFYFDPTTMNSILVPVPGHSIPFQTNDDESAMQPNDTLYKEDGSLEIDFTSLIDVRLLGDGKPEAASHSGRIKSANESGSTNNCNTSPCKRTDSNHDKATTTSTEKKDTNGWDEITEVLNMKKAELQKKVNCGQQGPTTTKDPSAKASWSYRALRGSALGPTVSLLRANKEL